jgi:aminoglycoside 3-N-acetyltransferase
MMTEAGPIAATPWPRTRESLREDLRQVGLTAGMTVIVHSSLQSLGWVNGGPIAVIEALQDLLTPSGTLVMPAHSGDLSEPTNWQHPPVPPEWVPIVRDTMPAYDPRRTPTRLMGRIAELFRTWPGVVRSDHPCISFAAWGRHAEWIVANHTLDFGHGERSPLARIYDLGGSVLLLGVGYDRNTSFHLAEHRITGVTPSMEGAPVLENGVRVWKTYQHIDLDTPLDELGTAFEAACPVRVGKAGSATARLFAQRDAVDFAVRWLQARHTGE